MISSTEALQRLIEGNQRFVSGVRSIENDSKQSQRDSLLKGQAPFAIILGCSDSRVPAELVFDQGLGDLFVIRVAGNIVAPSQIGSVEFAAELFGTPLVVVLGHTMCGAVQATIDDLKQPSNKHSQNIQSIVSRIRPSVEPLFNTDLRNHPDELMDSAIRANILTAVSHLQHGSQTLEKLVQEDSLMIVGAEYSLESGVVTFLE